MGNGGVAAEVAKEVAQVVKDLVNLGADVKVLETRTLVALDNVRESESRIERNVEGTEARIKDDVARAEKKVLDEVQRSESRLEQRAQGLESIVNGRLAEFDARIRTMELQILKLVAHFGGVTGETPSSSVVEGTNGKHQLES